VTDPGAANNATLRERLHQLKDWHDKTKSDRAGVYAVLGVSFSREVREGTRRRIF
jgi:hypothetical protein